MILAARTELTLESVRAIGEIREEWSELAAACGNPFATPEWAEAWLEHVAPGFDLRLRLFAGLRGDGTVAAVLPLVVVHGRRLRKARFLGFGTANCLGPVAAPVDLEPATAALRAALAATRGEWDMFLGESLPGHGWAARLDAAYSSREGSPVVRGSWADWDEYLAGRSSNFRQELRRKERRLVEQGLRYRLVTSPEELDPALDLLFDLHRARWGAEASPWFAGQEGFHRAFARTVLPHGWLRLAVLELDRGPVAVNHCFRFGSSDWSYQFGRDPSPELGSVGILTAAFGIRDAIEAGLDFELGPGNQAYKLRFATEDQGLETVAVGRGVRGQAALLALRRRAS